jgi:outer membrane biosynthesis protein TonB
VTIGPRLRKYLTTGVVLSVLMHFLLTGWGLFMFTTERLEAMPQDIVPVDVISDEQLSKLMKGIKTGDMNETKQQVDKVGDPNQVDPNAGKIDDKKPPVQPTADKQLPKPEDKPPEKNPDPPKPVAQDKPKDEPKPAKEEPKIDQIAEKLKQQDQPQKDPPKPEAKQTPQPPKPKERKFDQAKIAALLDKRDPTRQSIIGEQVNPKSALGVSAPAAMTQKNTFGWMGALQKRIGSCWSVPAGIRDADTIQVRILVKLGPDGTLQGRPQLAEAPAGSAIGPAFAESAIRAIEQCQPYNFLPKAEYKGGWDYMDMIFTPRDLFNR